MGISKFVEFILITWISMKVVPACSFSSAKYVWPLTNTTYSYEIKNSKAGDYTQCGFHFNGDHPSFAGPPLQLDAYSFPYIGIGIDDSNEFKSFSFAMYVNIFGSVGCIFHFKSTTPMSGTIEDVSVCISGENLTMKVTSVSGTSCNTILSVAALQGQWVMVQAGRDYDSSTEKFIVSSSSIDNVDTLGSLILGLPGTLRIGARHDGNMALPMTVTCITMYDVTTSTASDVGNIENQCKSPPKASGIPMTASTGCPVPDTSTPMAIQSTETTTEPPSVDTTAEPLSTETTLAAMTTKPASLCMRTELGSSAIKRSGSFYLLKRNVIVGNSNDLIVTVNVSRKRQCAIACIEDNGCLTFVFREMEAGPSLCSLFRTLTPQHVSAMFNSYLYAIKCQ